MGAGEWGGLLETMSKGSLSLFFFFLYRELSEKGNLMEAPTKGRT